MNEQAFELLMMQLNKHFADDLAFQERWEKHAAKVEKTLEDLKIFKVKAIFGLSAISGIVTFIVNLVVG